MGAMISLSVSPVTPMLQFCALAVVSGIFILLTPYTKVEESFGMQAVHDFLYLVPLTPFNSNVSTLEPNSINKVEENPNQEVTVPNVTSPFERHWDHENFPGVVPRTFLGPLIVASLTKPFALIVEDKMYVQLIARFILSLLVIAGFMSFGAALEEKYGPTTRRTLTVLTMTQFHFLFYASRLLPNTMALVFVLFAVARWIQRRFTALIWLSAFTVIIFRFDTVILFFWIYIQEVFYAKSMTITQILKIGIPAGLVALATTILFDSYMWGRWLWPEGEGIFFNIYLNKSQEWGTEPFFWYFYSALPRAMLLSLIFIPFCTQKLLKTVYVVTILYVATYSFLPHKELRFIIYAIPLFNACAANTIAVVIEKFDDTVKKKNQSYLMNVLYTAWYPEFDVDDETGELILDPTRQQTPSAKSTNGTVVAALKEKERDPTKYDAVQVNHSSKGARRRRNGPGGGGVRSALNKTEETLEALYETVTQATLQNQLEKQLTATTEGSRNSWSATFIFLLMAVHIWCNLAATFFLTLAAWHNYPGGEAVAWLNNHISTHDNYHPREEMGVYVCNLAAQTGFTRFHEMDGIYYNKESRLLERKFGHRRITYLILEKHDVQSLQSRCTGTGMDLVCDLGKSLKNCRILKAVNGFNGLDFSLSKQLVIKTSPMLWIFRCQK